MEDYGYKYIHNLLHFNVTKNSRNSRSIDMKPNHVEISDFMSILYSKSLREYIKPKAGFGDRVRISKFDLPFRKGYKHNLHKNVFKMVPLLLKNLQRVQSKTNNKKLYVGSSTKRMQLESFEYGLIYNQVGFQRTFAAFSKQYAQFLDKFFARASEIGRTMGGSNFRDLLPSKVPKQYRGEVYVL